MQKSVSRASVLFAVAVTVAACSLDVAPTVEDGSTFVRAKVNGLDWEVLGSRASLQISSASVQVLGYNVNRSAILLTLNGVNKVGVYPVRPLGSQGVQASVSTSSGFLYSADSVGTVSITELTANRLSGTFSFTASRTVSGIPATHTVTNGTFTVVIDPPGAIPIVP